MPFVYLARAFLVGAEHALWFEGVAVPLFCLLAILGVVKSPWYLVAGVTSHGLAWDAWHIGRCAYVQDWYSVFCGIVDLALAAYVASRIPIYQAALGMSGDQHSAHRGPRDEPNRGPSRPA
jgi:hypothetical protein